jgi:protease-4
MLLTERYLAINEAWLANAIQNMNAFMPMADRPMVQFMAANAYTERELGWLGISTVKANGKLVACIPVSGPLSLGWSWSGTNTEWVAQQLQIARENVNVAAVILKMNTPGGTVNGTAELAAEVDKTSKKMPVIAYTSYMCASAGLHIASQATENWIGSKTTGMGSLGIMGTYMSAAEKLKNEGIEVVVLRSKGSENKALLTQYEPLDKGALAKEQTLIDTMREEFLATVMKKRTRVSADIDGDMYYGADAIRAGFADYMGDMNAVIKRALYLGLK